MTTTTTTNIIHISLITTIISIFLTSQPVLAQTSPPESNSGGPSNKNSTPSILTISINLIVGCFFLGFFYYSVRYCTENATPSDIVPPRVGTTRRSRQAPRGLDADVIESFPIFDYAAVKLEKIGKGALECAVCLTEFEDDDALRLIPKCDHVFHPDCIDAWLVGHNTCPVCRCNLAETDKEEKPPVNDVVVEVDDVIREDDDQENEGNESMEQPLHGQMNRSRTIRNISFGRPRWLGKIGRSFSTGHVAVKQWENMERFTLRIPEELRKQIMSGKLEKTTSLVVLPRDSSTRSNFNTSRTRSGSAWVDRSGSDRSDRWGFLLARPFITRAPSEKSPNVEATSPLPGCSNQDNVTTSREIALQGAIQAELTQLPV